MKSSRPWYPALYMFAVATLLSSMVIALAAAARGRIEANSRAFFERAVVSVLPGMPASPTLPEAHELFMQFVHAPDAASGGAYTLRRRGRVAGYALPFEGRGFWSEIAGVIGIATDRRSITGIAFYRQNETPGLGAEITSPSFRRRFRAKVLADGDMPLKIVTGRTAESRNEIEAVTGATQTSTRLERMINLALAGWREEIEGEKQ